MYLHPGITTIVVRSSQNSTLIFCQNKRRLYLTGPVSIFLLYYFPFSVLELLVLIRRNNTHPTNLAYTWPEQRFNGTCYAHVTVHKRHGDTVNGDIRWVPHNIFSRICMYYLAMIHLSYQYYHKWHLFKIIYIIRRHSMLFNDWLHWLMLYITLVYTQQHIFSSYILKALYCAHVVFTGQYNCLLCSFPEE